MLTELVKQEPRLAGRPDAARRGVPGGRPQRRGDHVARGGGARQPAAAIRRSPTSTRASGAGPMRRPPTSRRCSASPRSFDLRVALRVDAAERRRAGRHREGARRRCARPSRIRATDERALVSAVAGRAPHAATRRGRSDGAPADRAEQPEPARLLRARRGARGAAAVPGGRRRARPAIADVPRRRQTPAFALGMLLPHLGFAYQELGQYDKAIATFEEARKLAPNDPALTGYLIQAQLAAKNYTAAAELARAGARRASRRPAARAPRGAGAAPERQGRSGRRRCSRSCVQKHGDDPRRLHRAGAGLHRRRTAARRRSRCCRTRRRSSRPRRASPSSSARCSRSRRSYAEAEAAFRQFIAHDPEQRRRAQLSRLHAGRARRAARRVGRISSSGRWQIEPDNGSYLDSLGWAYFKDGQLDLADEQPASAPPTSSRPTPSSRITTATCCSSSAATTRRSPRGRARSPATATRSIAATSTGRSAPPGRSSQDDEPCARRRSPLASRRRSLTASVRRAADEAARRARARRRPTPPRRSPQATRRLPRRLHAHRRGRASADRSAAGASARRLLGRPRGARVGAARGAAPFGQPIFIFVATATTRRCCCRATAGSSSTAVPATVLEAVDRRAARRRRPAARR